MSQDEQGRYHPDWRFSATTESAESRIARGKGERLAGERKAFIREMAMRFAALQEPAEGGVGTVLSFADDTCWRLAKGLWDSKPEDC